MSVCFSIEVAQIPDYQINQYFTDLLTEAKIEPRFKVSVQTTATASDIFGSSTPLVDTLCKGVQTRVEMDVWKGFTKS